jgi:LuxR family transcriptional regulator, maltose regulon positive regulatory protein
MSDPSKNSVQNARSMRLLQTKLYIPRAHPDLVKRPWLIRRLDEGLHARLILVSAPAGFGKTTLLSSWFAQTDLPAAWVSLDTRDNDPVRFWAYFIAALRTLQAGLGETALGMLQASQPPSIEVILTELLNEVAGIQGDFLLALDDFHAIDAESIHQGLTFLLENMPPQMHLVIASRTEPPLPLPLLRVRRALVELSLADLRFNPQEAADFLTQVMGLDLTAADIAALDKLTEGWIAGLQLAALSMQGMSDISGFIRSFTGSHRYVFDYLAQEVLNHQPEELQHFLLETSILERLSSSLCNALTGHQDSQERLEQLEQANLFLVALDQERRWYRYHHLFADFLQARLQQEIESGDLAKLHLRASEWYEKHDFPIEATSHALAAQDFERAETLMLTAVLELFVRSELATILNLLSALPEARRRANPQLSMAGAWALLATGQVEKVEEYLQDIEHSLGMVANGSAESLKLPANIRGALGEVSCLRASLSFHHSDVPGVMEWCQRARLYLGKDVVDGLFNDAVSLQPVITFNQALAVEFSGDIQTSSEIFEETIELARQDQNMHILPMAISHLAQLQVVQGKLREAADTYRQALHDAQENRIPSPLSGMAYTGMGNILVEWNDLQNAEAHLQRGIEMGRKWMQWEILVAGFTGMARLKIAQGETKRALAILQEMTDIGDSMQVPWPGYISAAFRALVIMRQGNIEPAIRWAEQSGIHAEDEPNFFQEGEYITLARVLLAQGELKRALSLAERLLTAAEKGQRWGRVIEILSVQSLILRAQGNLDLAMATLHRALELALPEGYVRIFVDEGQPMRELLQKAAIEGSFHAARLLEAFQETSSESAQKYVVDQTTHATAWHHPSETLIDPLSEREIEILSLIATGLTNQEIADRLTISLNTVKTHVKNIYSKLNTRSRLEATDRGRELGLI